MERAAYRASEANALTAQATDIENAVYDLKAVNPNKKPAVDARTPDELLAIIAEKGKEIDKALALLRSPVSVRTPRSLSGVNRR